MIIDFDGNYFLEVFLGKYIFVIFYIGYKMQDIMVGKSNQLNIKMEVDMQVLDEVVVVGYGVMKKCDVIGVVFLMKNKDVVIVFINNVMEVLFGKIVGMDIMKISGQVGEDVEILLCGFCFIYGDNIFLFIIDGILGSYN